MHDRISAVCWRPYYMPLRRPLATAHGVITAREGAIVAVQGDFDLAGYGEIAPMPEFGGGDLASALADLPAIAAELRWLDLESTVDRPFDWVSYRPPFKRCYALSAIYAVELALLDLISMEAAMSVSEYIHAKQRKQIRRHNRGLPPNERLPYPSDPATRVLVNALVGAPDIDDSIMASREAIAAGYSCVKLKVGMLDDDDAEIARIAAVRAAIGPGVALRLDANEAWSFERAKVILTRCADLDIDYCEQPLARDDLAGMRRLRQAVPVPVAADEAVADTADLQVLIDARAADVVILKPQLIGGFEYTHFLIAYAGHFGIRSVVTTAIEMGIGVAAALHLAALRFDARAEPIAHGLATLDLLEDDLIVESLPIVGGKMAVPTGPGLGVALDEAALDRYATADWSEAR